MVVLLIMSVSFIVTGCFFRSTTSLSILQYYLEKTVDEEGDLIARIVGAAVNDGDTKLEYAEIKGYFYSQEGTILATGFTRTISEGEPFTLDLGEVWDFTISCPSDPEDAHPSANILSWYLTIDSSGARIDGKVGNNGDVMLSFVKLTGTFYDAGGTALGSGTATTTGLGVGEIWEYTIWYPARDPEDVGYVNYAKVVVTETDYELQPAEDVDRATAEVGVLRGSTVMP